MITLTLLHPIQATPVQSWTFEHEPVIRIGRSTDNHVILYSAVVSRHHVEIRQGAQQWEIVNLGANGTYLDGKQITQVPVVDGVVIRLARSGPNIQIHLGAVPNLAGEKTLAQRAKNRLDELPTGGQAPTDLSDVAPRANVPPGEPSALSPAPPAVPERLVARDSQGDGANAMGIHLNCTHQRAQADMLFCPDCGQPLQIRQGIGDYQVVKTLSEDRLSSTHLVWRNGQSLLLKTLTAEGMAQPAAIALFEQQAQRLCQLNHPGLPRFTDWFVWQGQPYLVQEQVYGQDLYQRVAAQGALTAEQAIVCLLQVCDVLDYLHQQSPPFLHQNLRPEYLIQHLPVISSDSIVVTGFNPLRRLRPEAAMPNLSGYAAPEQQQGEVTAASDLFALGPLLVYLLTGNAPNAFYAQREQGFRFYPEYVPGLSTDLAAIVRRLTCPNPAERYATAGEVATALTQVVPLVET